MDGRWTSRIISSTEEGRREEQMRWPPMVVENYGNVGD